MHYIIDPELAEGVIYVNIHFSKVIGNKRRSHKV